MGRSLGVNLDRFRERGGPRLKGASAGATANAVSNATRIAGAKTRLRIGILLRKYNPAPGPKRPGHAQIRS